MIVIFHFIALLAALAFGCVLGATIVTDWLSRPRRVRPVATLPRAWAEHLGHLNSPTVTRRRRIEVIDV